MGVMQCLLLSHDGWHHFGILPHRLLVIVALVDRDKVLCLAHRGRLLREDALLWHGVPYKCKFTIPRTPGKEVAIDCNHLLVECRVLA